MSVLVASFRFLALAVVILVGTLLVLLAALVPVDVKGARPAAWVTKAMARSFFVVFGLRLTCSDPEAFRRHRGFLFPNHESYVDVIAVMALGPVRFLAMKEVKRWPFIGWIAMAIGTVFVDRSNPASRDAARARVSRQIAKRPHPPIALFPEGKIGQGNELLPFRFGAFEMAVEGGVAYRPCVIHYDRYDLIEWDKEPVWVSAWRLARYVRRHEARVVLLDEVMPESSDDPERLARDAHAVIDAAFLGLGGASGLPADEERRTR
ncbi:MAG: lysophospholipid acyltransferase family protein [Bacteroidota bacterium]